MSRRVLWKGFNLDSAIQMSAERTVRLSSRHAWNSEDTQRAASKSFLLLACCFIGQRTDTRHLPLLRCPEAECIVFAMEGLLLAHDLRSIAESGFNPAKHLTQIGSFFSPLVSQLRRNLFCWTSLASPPPFFLEFLKSPATLSADSSRRECH